MVGELQIRAERISGNDTTALYGFSIIAAGELLVGGRAGVVFDAAALGLEPMKRALITGGSGAIGAAIGRRLARDGFAVIVHANRNLAAAEELCAQLCAEG